MELNVQEKIEMMHPRGSQSRGVYNFWDNLYQSSCAILFHKISKQFSSPAYIDCQIVYRNNMLIHNVTLHRLMALLGDTVFYAKDVPLDFWVTFCQMYQKQVRQVILERNAGMLTCDDEKVSSNDFILEPYPRPNAIYVDLTSFVVLSPFMEAMHKVLGSFDTQDVSKIDSLQHSIEEVQGCVLGAEVPEPEITLEPLPDNPEQSGFVVQNIRIWCGEKIVSVEMEYPEIIFLVAQSEVIEHVEVSSDGGSEDPQYVLRVFWSKLYRRFLECFGDVLDMRGARDLLRRTTVRALEMTHNEHSGFTIGVGVNQNI